MFLNKYLFFVLQDKPHLGFLDKKKHLNLSQTTKAVLEP